jgi:hypothetical protein
MRRVHEVRRGLPLLSLPLLAIAQLLPEIGAGLWIRLALATIVVLLPGHFVAAALRRRGASATLAWALAAIAVALAITFAVHGSLSLALVLLAVIGVAGLVFSVRRPDDEPLPGSALVLVAGLALGIAVWHVAGIVHGDGLFHLARVRKLDDLGSLSLRAVDEFRDGGLHPGYAFPLWHALLAMVARLAGVDPAAVVLHEPSVLVPLALLVAYEAGAAVFRSAWAGAAVLVATVGLHGLAPGGGGAYPSLDLPATVSRDLLVPATIALFFRFVRAPSWLLGLTLAVAAMDLAFVHPTYAAFLAIPLVGYVVARIVLARRDLVPGALALGATIVPGALFYAWLSPIVSETASHNPSPAEKARSLHLYAAQLDVHSLTRYRLAPEVVSRTGAIAVAALVLVPLAGLAARRRWAAFVLGGTLVLLAIELSTLLFPRFADAVSLSQARRSAGFVPLAFAFAGGGAVLARFVGWFLLPVALAAGIVLQHEFPGSFGQYVAAGGPATATWIALWGGLAGLVVGLILASRYSPFDRTDAVVAAAALLFVIPVAVHGFSKWSPRTTHDSYALTPGVLHALRELPKRSVVFGDLETSYRVAAYAPLYVAVAPPAHVADTKANHPYARRRDWLRFLDTGDLTIPRRYGAKWLLLRRSELPRLQRRLPRVYGDARYVLLRV